MLVGDLRLGFGGGDGLMLLAALLRAIAVCLTKRLAGPQAVDTLAFTAVQAGVVSLACLFLALTTGPEMLPRLPASPEFWLACGYLVTFCTLFAFHAQNHAIRRSSPTHGIADGYRAGVRCALRGDVSRRTAGLERLVGWRADRRRQPLGCSLPPPRCDRDRGRGVGAGKRGDIVEQDVAVRRRGAGAWPET